MANPDTFELVRRVGRSGKHFCMDRIAETTRIVFGSDDGRVHEVDLAVEKPEPISFGVPRTTPEEVAAAEAETAENSETAPAEAAEPVRHTSWVTGIAVAGTHVVSGGWDRRLMWWDRDSGNHVRTVEKAHQRWLRGVVASPDGKLVASIADDMVCRLWDAASGKLVRELVGHPEFTPNNYRSMLFAAAFSSDGSLLATASKVGHVIVWDVKSGKQVGAFDSPENYTWDPRARRHSIGGIRSVTFSPDGNHVAVGGIGQIGNVDHLGSHALVQTYDWRKAERVHRFAHDKHKGLVEQLTYDANGQWLFGAGGAHGGFTFFMDLNGEPQGPEPAVENPGQYSKQKSGKFLRDDDAKFHVHGYAFNEDQTRLFAVGEGNLALWKMT